MEQAKKCAKTQSITKESIVFKKSRGGKKAKWI